jgi:ketosteroid isomerase-like protein
MRNAALHLGAHPALPPFCDPASHRSRRPFRAIRLAHEPPGPILVRVSQGNVAISRRAIDAVNRGDLDAWLAEFHPEIEWFPLPDELEGPYRGHEGLLKMLAVWQDTLADFRVIAEVHIDAGDYVIAPARAEGRPAGSDAAVTLDEVLVSKIRDGKIVEVREYRTREEAFEAVGSPVRETNP